MTDNGSVDHGGGMIDQESENRESEGERRAPARRIAIFGRRLPLPARRGWRIALGGGLIIGGFLGFLPVLGFWMLPLGVLVLSVDLIFVRRWRRRTAVKWGRSRMPRDPSRTNGKAGERRPSSDASS